MVLSMNHMVNVVIDTSPSATARDTFNAGLIIGKSSVINAIERVRQYRSPAEMVEDGFLTSSAEYKAATLYFGSTKRPERLFVGVKLGNESYLDAAIACRNINYDWYGFTALDATRAEIVELGKFAESASPFTTYFYTSPFDQPEFDISYSGAAGNFEETVTNGKITILFDVLPITDPVASEFTITHDANVVPTIFAYNSIVGEVTLTFTPIEEVIPIEIFDEMKSHGFLRSHGMYSGQSNAVAAVMGFAMGANTQTNNSAYTLAYKNLPGVATSNITENLISQIKKANGNVYIQRGGRYNVYEQGTQASGAAFDDIIGIDTLASNVQHSAMRLLMSANKIHYTDDGVTRIINAITPDFEQARNVGFIAPGLWTYGDIVINNEILLEDNTMLPTGYAVFAAKVASVSQAVRETRVAPAIICPVKLSGAIEHITITIPVNK